MHSLAMMIGRRSLVLKEFQINLEGEEYVHIVARKAGLIAWLLTHLGVDSTTVFRVYANRIEFTEGSLSGEIQTVLPLRSISIATCGYTKPVLLLFFAVIFLLISLSAFFSPAMVGGIVSLLLALVFFIFYFLNKSLLISVISNSSWPIAICFKRSVIEGVKIEYEHAQQVIQIINQLLMIEASK